MVQERGFWLLSKEREVVCMYSCKLQMQHWRFGQIWCKSASTGSTAQLLKVLLTEMPRCDVESMFCVVLQQRRDI